MDHQQQAYRLSFLLRELQLQIIEHAPPKPPLIESAINEAGRLACEIGYKPPITAEVSESSQERHTFYLVNDPISAEAVNIMTAGERWGDKPGVVVQKLWKAPVDRIEGAFSSWHRAMEMEAHAPTDQCRGQAGKAGTAKPQVNVSDGFYSPADIAKAIGSREKADAIRMALKRAFEANRLPDDAWMENNNPAKGQAGILYRLSVVRPFLSRFEPNTYT